MIRIFLTYHGGRRCATSCIFVKLLDKSYFFNLCGILNFLNTIAKILNVMVYLL
jgi:hypothetical protein